MERSSKMEFFQKLGYSREDVVRVLGKLGEGALVNDVLQELIQTGSRPGAHEGSAVPLLVPRGSCATLDSAQRGPAAELEEDYGGPASSLRPIVIDGSNVAMSHGNKEAFSCRGIQLAVDWFRDRGHTYIKVFVPSWRKDPPRSDTPIREQHVLEALERQAVLVYTPSRKVNGKRVVCYDDRYIVKVAYELDGVIVSNDNYRDLQSENPEWKWFIEQRLLMFSFVNDRFMPPDDPLGRRGPTLNNFLSRKPKPPEPSWQHCPYGGDVLGDGLLPMKLPAWSYKETSQRTCSIPRMSEPKISRAYFIVGKGHMYPRQVLVPGASASGAVHCILPRAEWAFLGFLCPPLLRGAQEEKWGVLSKLQTGSAMST